MKDEPTIYGNRNRLSAEYDVAFANAPVAINFN